MLTGVQLNEMYFEALKCTEHWAGYNIKRKTKNSEHPSAICIRQASLCSPCSSVASSLADLLWSTLVGTNLCILENPCNISQFGDALTQSLKCHNLSLVKAIQSCMLVFLSHLQHTNFENWPDPLTDAIVTRQSILFNYLNVEPDRCISLKLSKIQTNRN